MHIAGRYFFPSRTTHQVTRAPARCALEMSSTMAIFICAPHCIIPFLPWTQRMCARGAQWRKAITRISRRRMGTRRSHMRIYARKMIDTIGVLFVRSAWFVIENINIMCSCIRNLVNAFYIWDLIINKMQSYQQIKLLLIFVLLYDFI